MSTGITVSGIVGWLCANCGNDTDACYTDGGTLAMELGMCLCRECYIAQGHPECRHCGELTAKEWKYCCHCGKRLIASARLTTEERKEHHKANDQKYRETHQDHIKAYRESRAAETKAYNKTYRLAHKKELNAKRRKAKAL